jgi:hypothetical protein
VKIKRFQIWFNLPFIPDNACNDIQKALENRAQKNDLDYIYDFLKGVPKVQVYFAEHHIEDKKPISEEIKCE